MPSVITDSDDKDDDWEYEYDHTESEVSSSDCYSALQQRELVHAKKSPHTDTRSFLLIWT
jgi:hypothetical protein